MRCNIIPLLVLNPIFTDDLKRMLLKRDAIVDFDRNEISIDMEGISEADELKLLGHVRYMDSALLVSTDTSVKNVFYKAIFLPNEWSIKTLDKKHSILLAGKIALTSFVTSNRDVIMKYLEAHNFI